MAFGQDKKTAGKRSVEASNSTSRRYDDSTQQGQDAKSASLNEAFHSATMRTQPAVVKKRKKNQVQMRLPVTCHRCGEYSCTNDNLLKHYAPAVYRIATRCPYTTEKFYLDGFSEEVYNICFNQEVAGIREEQAYEWARTIFYDPEREEEGEPDAQVYAYVVMRDGVAVPTYIGVTTGWEKRDDDKYKMLPGEIRVVVVDNVPKWICRSIESCILYCFNLNKIPPANRVLRNDNHQHSQLHIPAWLKEMVTGGHATMEDVFKFLRTEAMRMLKGSLANSARLSKELWLTPAQEEDRNKSLSTPVQRRLSYTPEEMEQDFQALTNRYYDRADEQGTFPEEERRPMFIRADGSVLRATNDEEQDIFEEAMEKVRRLREASRTEDNSAQLLRQLDQDDDDEDDEEEEEEGEEDEDDEDEEEGDAIEN